MNIAVLYYDDNTPRETLQASANTIVDALEDVKVLVLPKNFDLLLNCSPDQLLHIRSIIDTALAVKLQEIKSNLPAVDVTEDVEMDTSQSKIIDITKYLH